MMKPSDEAMELTDYIISEILQDPRHEDIVKQVANVIDDHTAALRAEVEALRAEVRGLKQQAEQIQELIEPIPDMVRPVDYAEGGERAYRAVTHRLYEAINLLNR